MPTTFTPAAGNEYRQYKNSVEDVTRDYEKQLKTNRDQNDRDVTNVREQAAAEREKARAEADATVTANKDTLNENMTRDRELNKREVEKMRAQMYDRSGRFNGEAESLKSQLEAAKKSYDSQHDKDIKDMREIDSHYQERLTVKDQDKAQAVEDALVAYRTSLGEQSDYAVRARQENERQAKTESQDRYQRLDDARISEQDELRRYQKDAFDQLKTGFDRQVSSIERAENERGLKSRDSSRQDAEDSIKQQREAHAREMHDVRESVGDMIAADQTSKKVLSSKIDSYEREQHRDIDIERSRLVAERDSAIAAERERSANAENHQIDIKRATLKEQDAAYNDILHTQTKDYNDREKTLREGYESSFNQVNKRAQMDREQSNTSMERQAAQLSEIRDEALTKQAKAYQDSGKRERESLNTQLAHAQKELQVKKTSSDPNDISPAAEAAVRNLVTREYEKTFATDHKRDQDTIEGIQESYSNRMSDALTEAEARETDRNRMMVSEHHRERSDLINEVDDSEHRKMAALRDADQANAREKDKLVRSYAGMMDQQRRKYEELLQASRYNASEKLQMTRREQELETKMTHRAFSGKQNELIHDYEKRLADQKQELETRLVETKDIGDQALRDAERKNRLGIDEVIKNYEGRIAQMEQQQKERERSVTVSYEDQIDRMRRSNAVSTKKV